MKCVNCGCVLTEDSGACNQCGESVKQPSIQESVTESNAHMPIGQTTDTPNNVAEPKKRCFRWLWIIGGAVLLIVAVLLTLYAIKSKTKTTAVTKLPEPVLDYKNIHIEIGQEYTFDDLLKYNMDVDPLYVENGQFWTRLSGYNTVERFCVNSIRFGTGPINDVYDYSNIEFYPILDESLPGRPAEDTNIDGNMVSVAGWDEAHWKYQYVVKRMDIRTEGVSFAGIEVGDDLEDVLEMYPMASCTSNKYMRNNNINEDYASAWQIYTDEEGNFIDFTEYFEETKAYNTRPDLYPEFLTGDTMLNVVFYTDAEGTVRMIKVCVHHYGPGSHNDR